MAPFAMRDFELTVHDSGGRYPLALELAPDLPSNLMRYDSQHDPYRDFYRGETEKSGRSEREKGALVTPTTQIPQTTEATASSSSSPAIRWTPTSHTHTLSDSAASRFTPPSSQRRLARLKNWFVPETRGHARSRSADDDGSGSGSASTSMSTGNSHGMSVGTSTGNRFLAFLAPAPPSPLGPPPLPPKAPKPSSVACALPATTALVLPVLVPHITLDEVEKPPIADVHAPITVSDQKPLLTRASEEVPAPPVYPGNPGYPVLDKKPCESPTLDCDPDSELPTPPMEMPDTVFAHPPQYAMLRLEQWAQTLKGQRFEEEEGMLGPYETNSVVMAPSIKSIKSVDVSEKRKEKKKKRGTTPTDSAKTHTTAASTKESPKPKTDKRSVTESAMTETDSVETPVSKVKSRVKEKTSKHSAPASKAESKASKAPSKARSRAIPDDSGGREARSSTPSRHTRDQSITPSIPSQSDQYANGQTSGTKHQTDRTQSTESFGHILHSNGAPVPVNIQTQPGLLPRSAPSRGFHRRNNSNGTPLNDIVEHSEPLPSNHSNSNSPYQYPPPPTTGEAAKYYAMVESVRDTPTDEAQFPIFSSAPPTAPHVPSVAQTEYNAPAGQDVNSMPPMMSGPPYIPGITGEPQYGLNIHLNDAMLPGDNYGPSQVAPGAGLDQTFASSYEHQQATPSYLQNVPPMAISPAPPPGTLPNAMPTIVSAAAMPPASVARSVPGGYAGSVSSDGTPSVTTRSLAPTVATTHVPQMVQHSSFHDETLCQLLDASRLNLLGEEAKKALMRAARARVVELKDIREKTREMEKGVTRTEPLVIKKKEKRDKRGKRSRRVAGDESDEETVKGDNASTVEDLIESLLEKQDVDQATREHICKDPGNHSRCLSSDDDLDHLEEDLYRGRVCSSPTRRERDRGRDSPYDMPRGMYPFGMGYPFPAPYPVAYPMPLVQPSIPSPMAQGMYQGFPQQQAAQVPPQEMPSQPAPQPQPEAPTAARSVKQRSIAPTAPAASPGAPSVQSFAHTHATDPNYRTGVQSRDSHELMAEVLNINYAGVPVKQILEDFIRERHAADLKADLKAASIYTIHTASDAVQTTPPQPDDTTPVASRAVSPVQSHRSARHASIPPSSAQSRKAASTRPPSSHHTHRDAAPSTRPPSSRASQVAPDEVHHAGDLPSQPASRRHASAPPTEKSESSKRSTTVDWAWVPEIKIRVQPPTTVTNTTNTPVIPPTEEARAAPQPPTPVASPPASAAHPPVPPPATRSQASNIDYTASYLPFDVDRDLPPLPPSTYAPSHPDTPKFSPESISSRVSTPPRMSPPFKATPWELVTHRLCSWALVWEDDYFFKALESISIGRPVDEFPLTVVTMMIFKRILQLRMSGTPPQPCDKLFVPPNIAEAINKAVHAKEYGTAQALLEALWYAFGLTEPPRVIISLIRHGAIKSAWVANRYDLVTHRFATYIVCNSMPTQKEWDGRPFMWWHAIRQAWPTYNIPDPVALTQVIKPITVPLEFTEDISLRAASIARNLLLGIRPEHDHDIPKLRKQTWNEVNRLHTKKRAGRLLVQKNEL